MPSANPSLQQGQGTRQTEEIGALSKKGRNRNVTAKRKPCGEVVNRPRLAHTLAHEMAHIRGMGHKQMRGSSRYDWGEGWEGRYAWADSFPLEAKVQPVAATLGERRGARLEHARAMLKSWERRSRLAAGKLRRWRGHVRDLEKLLSAAAEARTDGGA